jgi:hypothetical protein
LAAHNFDTASAAVMLDSGEDGMSTRTSSARNADRGATDIVGHIAGYATGAVILTAALYLVVLYLLGA